MSLTDNDALRLLVETGILDAEDAKSIQTEQSEVLLNMMIDKKALLHSEIEEARVILQTLATGTNRTRKLKAQTSLVRIITSNLHRRMGKAGDRLREQKERITKEVFPVGAALAASDKGE